MKFYTYTQNNSGGSFDVDENVAHYVIIEAENSDDADMIAEGVGVYFDGCSKGMDCECCGDRWYSAYREGSESPQIYGDDPIKEVGGMFNKQVIIYYKSGKKEHLKP